MARRRAPRRPGALTELRPLKIVRQMVLLQTAWYIGGFVMILFSALVAGEQFSLDLLLDWRSVRGDTTVGWMLGVVWLLDGLVGATGLLILVERSKLVLDFALSLHAIHLAATTFYSRGLPRNLLWWAVQLASAALMTALGVWCCRRRELRPISFGGMGAAGTGTANGNSTAAAAAGTAANGSATGGTKLAPGESPAPNDDEDLEAASTRETGGLRGGRRGRGRDVSGEYEMVAIKTSGDAGG